MKAFDAIIIGAHRCKYVLVNHTAAISDYDERKVCITGDFSFINRPGNYWPIEIFFIASAKPII
ncbi:MAG: hypothetical protein NZ730_00005 [Porticoccaceae bacterium]|nr:hypothetical protein [Porticoccaceae bacterium]